MTNEQASKILGVILQGIDPVTGEILPEDHFCNQPDVLRALHLAILALTEGQGQPHEEPSKKPNAGRPWTNEDLTALKKLYLAGTSMEEICKALARRERGINRQLIYLGLVKEEPQFMREVIPGYERAGQRWNWEEDQKLERMFKDQMPIKEMAEELHRTEYSIFCRMEKRGLYGDLEGYPVWDDLPIWKNEDNKTLRQMASEGKSIREIAEYFGRSEKSISARMFYMGLGGDAPVSVRKK